MLNSELMENWKVLAEDLKTHAIFSFMTEGGVRDVLDFFEIGNIYGPVIAAHHPSTDYKYKSNKLELEDSSELKSFVMGVLSGAVQRLLKSEALPTPNPKSGVKKVVGANVFETVMSPEQDVLLLVYIPWCSVCKTLLPYYEMLGKAVQAESRVIIAKIDYSSNDLPSNWNIKSTPALLWFPARDKPYENTNAIVPRPYWDAGFTLPELTGFVQRDTSFDVKTLKIATPEQLGSLLADEEIYRAKYLEEERVFRRNEGRVEYENVFVDYLLGEVVFDGKRWHVALVVVLALIIVLLLALVVYLVLLIPSSSPSKSSPAKRKKP